MKFLDRIVEKVIAKQIENYKAKLLENKDEILFRCPQGAHVGSRSVVNNDDFTISSSP